MDSFGLGLLIVLAGAFLQGSWALPQKFVRGWAWEKMWLYFCFFALVILPWFLVAVVVPSPMQVYSNVSGDILFATALFGAGWGVGNVLFGLGVASVGMALAFAIIISLTSALGMLIPLLVSHPDQLMTARGGLLILGLLLVIGGVALCSKAGALKDAAAASGPRPDFARGLLICIASGVASPMMNFAFAFGKPIQDQAAVQGANPGAASIALLAVAVGAGFLVNAGYCVFLLVRNHSFAKGAPADRTRNLLCVAAMGAMWLFGFFLYGIGSTKLGDMGTVLGWPILMTSMVLIANLWGLVTGEWKGAGRGALRFLGSGLALMVVALIVMSRA